MKKSGFQSAFIHLNCKYMQKITRFFALSGFILGVFLFSCKGPATETQQVSSHESFRIDTFSTIPPEIDGCSCYFANDSSEWKQGHYIYVNDFAKQSFVKLNGVLTKFTLVEENVIDSLKTRQFFKNDTSELLIESQIIRASGDETWHKTGMFLIQTKSGLQIQKTFFGECGC